VASRELVATGIEVVERWGTGTTRIAQLCIQQGLPAPEFSEESGEVWVMFRKDPYNDERLRGLGLSGRQVAAVGHVQQNGSISNAEYRTVTGVSARTATTELAGLVASGVLSPTGGRGPTVRYRLPIAHIPQ
jgi:ATP-dependent DNA helicase RecG